MAPRKAKQFALPFPLNPATQGNYRSPAWQGRVELYARNYFTPSEYENIKRMSIKFLPMEARLIASQFATSHEHRKKIQKFVGSVYVYDLAFALLRDLRVAVQNVARQTDTFGAEGKNIIVDLMNNIRGWRFVKLVNGAGAAGTFPTITINANPMHGDPARHVEVDVQMRRLSSQQEVQVRGRGYVGINGEYYTIQRVPLNMTAPGSVPRAGPPGMNRLAFDDRHGPAREFDPTHAGHLYAYQTNAQGEYAVESILNQLIELCNSDTIHTKYFTIQSRMNVFMPLDLESRANGAGELTGGVTNTQAVFADRPETVQALIARNNAVLPGNTTWTNNNRYGLVDGVTMDANLVDYQFPNAIRGITVPAGASGYGRSTNAGMMEYENLVQSQNELLGLVSKWAETGLGVLTMGGVDFDAYRRGEVQDGDWGNILGNRPAALKYAEYNYAGDTCGPGYAKLFYTADPSSDPKAKRAEQWISDGMGGRVPNPLAKVGVCAPTIGTQMPLTRAGEQNVYTDMEYPVVHRMAAAQKRAKRKAPAKRKPRK